MKTIESDNQKALFTWAKNIGARKYPILKKMFAIPNGGKRNRTTAINLKKEGVLSGVWDIFLPYPSKGKCGLFIEMKAGRNKLTDNQKSFKEGLEEFYEFGVAYSWLEAKELIEEYLDDSY